jgi:hypothetical protein
VNFNPLDFYALEINDVAAATLHFNHGIAQLQGAVFRCMKQSIYFEPKNVFYLLHMNLNRQ